MMGKMKILAGLVVLILASSVPQFGQQNSNTSNNIACNCVLYARSKVSSLPSGLNTQADKARIINSRFPKVGTIAIHSINHVSYVERTEVASDGTIRITLREANYQACQITSRSGTASQLGIIGYFDPAFSAGNTPPEVTSATPTSFRAGTQSITFSGRGFDAGSVQVVVLGGACSTWGRCVIPTSVITNRSSNRMTAPFTINGRGRYTAYIFNSREGRSSNGISITVN